MQKLTKQAFKNLLAICLKTFVQIFLFGLQVVGLDWILR